MSVDFQESKRTPWENHRENQGKTWKIIEKTSAFLGPKFNLNSPCPISCRGDQGLHTVANTQENGEGKLCLAHGGKCERTLTLMVWQENPC